MAKVERAHRDAAASIYFTDPGRTERVVRWVDGNRVTYVQTSTFGCMVEVAQAIADAEARGFAAGVAKERADVVAWIGVSSLFETQPEKLIEEIKAGEHVTSEHGAGVGEKQDG